jgi:hypothetical protein
MEGWKIMAFDYDLTYNDFNPTVFYVTKVKMLNDGVYHDHDFAELAYIFIRKREISSRGKRI